MARRHLLWLTYYSSDDYLASMKGAIQAHLKTSVYLAKVQLQTAPWAPVPAP